MWRRFLSNSVLTNTLVTIGGVLGALTGVISWLLRKLLRAKDEQIAEQKNQTEKAEHDRGLLEGFVYARGRFRLIGARLGSGCGGPLTSLRCIAPGRPIRWVCQGHFKLTG